MRLLSTAVVASASLVSLARPSGTCYRLTDPDAPLFQAIGSWLALSNDLLPEVPYPDLFGALDTSFPAVSTCFGSINPYDLMGAAVADTAITKCSEKWINATANEPRAFDDATFSAYVCPILEDTVVPCVHDVLLSYVSKAIKSAGSCCDSMVGQMRDAFGFSLQDEISNLFKLGVNALCSTELYKDSRGQPATYTCGYKWFKSLEQMYDPNVVLAAVEIPTAGVCAAVTGSSFTTTNGSSAQLFRRTQVPIGICVKPLDDLITHMSKMPYIQHMTLVSGQKSIQVSDLFAADQCLHGSDLLEWLKSDSSLFIRVLKVVDASLESLEQALEAYYRRNRYNGDGRSHWSSGGGSYGNGGAGSDYNGGAGSYSNAGAGSHFNGRGSVGGWSNGGWNGGDGWINPGSDSSNGHGGGGSGSRSDGVWHGGNGWVNAVWDGSGSTNSHSGPITESRPRSPTRAPADASEDGQQWGSTDGSAAVVHRNGDDGSDWADATTTTSVASATTSATTLLVSDVDNSRSSTGSVSSDTPVAFATAGSSGGAGSSVNDGAGSANNGIGTATPSPPSSSQWWAGSQTTGSGKWATGSQNYATPAPAGPSGSVWGGSYWSSGSTRASTHTRNAGSSWPSGSYDSTSRPTTSAGSWSTPSPAGSYWAGSYWTTGSRSYATTRPAYATPRPTASAGSYWTAGSPQRPAYSTPSPAGSYWTGSYYWSTGSRYYAPQRPVASDGSQYDGSDASSLTSMVRATLLRWQQFVSPYCFHLPHSVAATCDYNGATLTTVYDVGSTLFGDTAASRNGSSTGNSSANATTAMQQSSAYHGYPILSTALLIVTVVVLLG